MIRGLLKSVGGGNDYLANLQSLLEKYEVGSHLIYTEINSIWIKDLILKINL